MNEMIGVIMKRRSIRKYEAEQIPEEDVRAILDCGLYAPSAMNQQDWHFTVIRDKRILDRMGDIMRERMLRSGNERMIERARAGFSPFHGAPTVIMITADPSARFIEIDCGAAAENIALAAEALGYGSCLMAAPGGALSGPEGEELKKELGVPGNYAHVISVAIGYKEGEPPAPRPRKPDLVTWLK